MAKPKKKERKTTQRRKKKKRQRKKDHGSQRRKKKKRKRKKRKKTHRSQRRKRKKTSPAACFSDTNRFCHVLQRHERILSFKRGITSAAVVIWNMLLASLKRQIDNLSCREAWAAKGVEWAALSRMTHLVVLGGPVVRDASGYWRYFLRLVQNAILIFEKKNLECNAIK
jgi:hypothetical protein